MPLQSPGPPLASGDPPSLSRGQARNLFNFAHFRENVARSGPRPPIARLAPPPLRYRAPSCRQRVLLLERFQKADEIADLPGIQPELGHARMTGRNTFAKRFLE
jgi:hypothetical protein